MPKDTKNLGNNKARACESLGFVHKKRLCQRFDTTPSIVKFRTCKDFYFGTRHLLRKNRHGRQQQQGCHPQASPFPD